MLLSNRVIRKEQEFQKDQLNNLFREHERSNTGKFLIVDFSSSTGMRRIEPYLLAKLIEYFQDLQTRNEKKYPDAVVLGPPVSILIDDADRYLLQTGYGLDSPAFENIIDAGRAYFDHQILITRSPYLSTKVLRITSTLLIGSNSIRSLEVLENTKPWEHHRIFNDRNINRK